MRQLVSRLPLFWLKDQERWARSNGILKKGTKLERSWNMFSKRVAEMLMETEGLHYYSSPERVARAIGRELIQLPIPPWVHLEDPEGTGLPLLESVWMLPEEAADLMAAFIAQLQC